MTCNTTAAWAADAMNDKSRLHPTGTVTYNIGAATAQNPAIVVNAHASRQATAGANRDTGNIIVNRLSSCMNIVCKALQKFESSLDPSSVGDRCQAKTTGIMQMMITSRVVALKTARSYMMEC